MILRKKVYKGSVYYQAWHEGRLVLHLGKLETIVEAVQCWKEAKRPR